MFLNPGLTGVVFTGIDVFVVDQDEDGKQEIGTGGVGTADSCGAAFIRF